MTHPTSNDVTLLGDLQVWIKLLRDAVGNGEARISGRLQHQGNELLERISRAALSGDSSAPEKRQIPRHPPRTVPLDDDPSAVETTRESKLETALRGLYWDQVDYLTLNKLGGMQNHWTRATREALGMDIDDVRPSPEETTETFRQGIDRVRRELREFQQPADPTPEQVRAYAQAHDDPDLFNSVGNGKGDV